jgi:KTSC domain
MNFWEHALPIHESSLDDRPAETYKIWGMLLVAVLIVTGAPLLAEQPKPDPVISHIPRQQVQSTAIAAVGYSKGRHILEIKFANGAAYRYLDVSPSVYRDLMAAESKTRYYQAYIKGNYRSLRVRPRETEQTTH